jgi:tetratricopeptide (TPR) repeat protein
MFFTGRIDEGRRFAEESLELARRIGHLGGEMLARRSIAVTGQMLEPDLDALEDAARKDLELCEAIRSPWASQSHAWVSLALQLRGSFDEALKHAEEAIVIEPVTAWSGLGWSAKIMCHARAAQRAQALVMVAEPMPALPGPDDPTPIGTMGRLFSAAHAVALLGLEPEAQQLYPLVAARVHRVPVMLFESVLAERIAGMVASTLRLWDEADQHFAAATKIADDFPNRFDKPSVELWQGKTMLERGRVGDRDDAKKKIERARAEFERRGMAIDAKMAAELLAR